jgi:hypothetical protein
MDSPSEGESLPCTTPLELIGDVKKLDELKEEIDREYLSFSSELYRRGKLLIRLHEVVLLENLKKQTLLEKIKILFDRLTELSQLDVCISIARFSLMLLSPSSCDLAGAAPNFQRYP